MSAPSSPPGPKDPDAPSTRPTPPAEGLSTPGPPTAAGAAPSPTTGPEGASSSAPARSGDPVVRGSGAPDLVPDPPLRWPSIRTPVVLLVLMILLCGVVYPDVITLAADVVDPVSPTYLTTLIGENITNPALFWERPSQIDWVPVFNATQNTGAGDEEPWGPTCPYSPSSQCSALMNATLQYVWEYGLENTTVPLDLVSPSASGLDPDLYPDAALIQVPRVAHAADLSISTIWGLVNDTTTQPIAGFVGPAYVDVISLDQKLIAMMPGTTPDGPGAGS